MTLITCPKCGTELYDMKIPVWLLWDSRYDKERDESFQQLRGIFTDHRIATKAKEVITKEAKGRGKRIHSYLSGTRLNHLFAWTMIQKLEELQS